MKTFLLLLSTILIIQFSFSQNVKKIKKNENFIWGESTAKTLEQADNFALKDLVSQISTKVESSFSTTMIEDGENLEEYTRSAISTYSNIYLNDAQRIVIKKRKKTYVLRYMDKKIVSEIFENRKTKILDYTNLAVKAEKEYRIADALRYYYWALALLNSHPENNKIKYTLSDNTSITLLTFINSEVDNILESIAISISDTIRTQNEKCFILDIRYNGVEVSNLDYVYWTGNTYSNLYSAKDGIGIVEFFNNQAGDFSNLRIKLEYQYLSRVRIDKEVESVMEMSILPRFKNAEIKIPLVKEIYFASNKINTQPKLNAIGIHKVDTSNNASALELKLKNYSRAITQINQSILQKDNSNILDIFTENGLTCYDKIISYGNAKLLPLKDSLKYIAVNNKTLVRSTPMLFDFPNNNKKFIEDVVYTFDSTGRICNINFALSNISKNNILNKSDRFGSLEEKYFLINFLESYKTAYCLEKIEFIQSVFDDDALIIVGTVLEPAESIDAMYMMLVDQNIKYTKYSKDEYVEHLADVFSRKEYVNIQFEESEVRKTGGEDKVYGIQIAQNYYSSNYSDKGYLFLMIDLNDSVNPKIYVRTWQPERNMDGSVIGLEHFSIK